MARMSKLKQCQIIGGIQIAIYLLLLILTIVALTGKFDKSKNQTVQKNAEKLKRDAAIKTHRKWSMRYSKLVIYILKLGFAIFLIIAARKKSTDYLLVYAVLSIEGFIIALGTLGYDFFNMFDYVGTPANPNGQGLVAMAAIGDGKYNPTEMTVDERNKANDARLILQDLFDVLAMLLGAMRTYKARKEIMAARKAGDNNFEMTNNRKSDF